MRAGTALWCCMRILVNLLLCTGKRMMINLPSCPAIDAYPLRQIIAAAREHNAGLLGGTSPPGTSGHMPHPSQPSLAAAPSGSSESLNSGQGSPSDHELQCEVQPCEAAAQIERLNGASQLQRNAATWIGHIMVCLNHIRPDCDRRQHPACRLDRSCENFRLKAGSGVKLVS